MSIRAASSVLIRFRIPVELITGLGKLPVKSACDVDSIIVCAHQCRVYISFVFPCVSGSASFTMSSIECPFGFVCLVI